MTLIMAFTILTYDAQTGLYARIKDGTVWPQVRKQYTSIQGNFFYQLGYDASERVLKGRYVPAYDCAVRPDLTHCKKPYKKWGL